MGKDPNQIREDIAATRERMGETVEAIGYRADVPSRVKEGIADKVGSVKDSISGGVQAMTAKVSDIGSSIGEAMPSGEEIRTAARRTVSTLSENPIALAVGGLVVGFTAGLLLPRTRVETETMRPALDNAKRVARQTGEQVVEHGKQVLQEVASTAKESAQRHGQQVASQMRDEIGTGNGELRDGGATSGGQAGRSADMTSASDLSSRRNPWPSEGQPNETGQNAP